MEMRRLGSRGPEIAVVGYQAWEAGGEIWGSEVGDDRVLAAMEAGVDAGIRPARVRLAHRRDYPCDPVRRR
jgi:aryl-alcohol dehydrogenase-like predicted oxidoreductase